MDVPNGTANLGIRIANIGADEAKKGLVEIGVTGDAAGSKVSQAFMRTQGDAQRLGVQLNALTQITEGWWNAGKTARDIAASLAAAIQEEGLMASASAAQIEQLAAAQATLRGQTAQITDSTRAMTLTQIEAIKMNEALATSSVAAGNAMGMSGMQASMMRMRLGSMLGGLIGVNGAVLGLAGAFGSMAIGSVAVIGVMAGIAAMAYGYEKLSLSLKGVTADQEKAIEEFEKAQKLKAAGGKEGEANTGLLNRIASAQPAMAGVAAFGVTVGGLGEGLSAAYIASRKKLLGEDLANVQASLADLTKAGLKADQETAERQATTLARLIKDGAASDKQRQLALGLEKAYYADEKALADKFPEQAAGYGALGDQLKGAFTKADKVPKAQAAASVHDGSLVDQQFANNLAVSEANSIQALKDRAAAMQMENEALKQGEATRETYLIGLQYELEVRKANTFSTEASKAAYLAEAAAVRDAALAHVGIVAAQKAVADAAAKAQSAAAKAADEAAKLAGKSWKTEMQTLTRDVQRDFSSMFDQILNGGTDTFGKLWKNVWTGWTKLVADMLGADVMRMMGDKLTSFLRGGPNATDSAILKNANSGPAAVAGATSGSPGFDTFSLGYATSFVSGMIAIGDSIAQTSAMNKQAAIDFANDNIKWKAAFDTLAGIGNQNPLNSKFQSMMDSAIQAAQTAIKNSPAAKYGASGVGAFGSTTGLLPGAGTIQGLDDYIASLKKAQGSGKNAAQDRDLAALLTQLELLDAEYKKQTVAAQDALNSDLHVRLLRAQGNTVAADALALQITQAKEYKDAVTAGYDAATLALLAQVQAQEKLTAATNGTSTAALNMVSGYKLQATIFGAMAAHGGGSGVGIGGIGLIGQPYTPPYPFSGTAGASGSSGGGSGGNGTGSLATGDLTIPLKIDGHVLGTILIKNFRSRQARGDQTLAVLLS
jgi:hypothetical protein